MDDSYFFTVCMNRTMFVCGRLWVYCADASTESSRGMDNAQTVVTNVPTGDSKVCLSNLYICFVISHVHVLERDTHTNTLK